MKHLKRNVITGAIAILTGAALSSSAFAADWNMATPYGESNFHTVNISEFADEVRTATDGSLNIVVHSGASLIKHPEIKNAVRSGQIEAGEFFLSRLANENAIFQVDSIPFLASNYDAAAALWTASRPKIEELLAKQGLEVLFSVPWPPQGFYSTTPINSLSDMSGMKFRANNTATETLAQLAGAVPTQVEVPDIPQAFSTGRVEAMATSPSTGANTQAWDYVNYFYHTQAWLPKNIVVVNSEMMAKLTDAEQAAVHAAAATAETRGWAASVAETDAKIAILKENGMTVESPSDDFIKELSEVGATMTAEWLEKTGADGEKILSDYKK